MTAGYDDVFEKDDLEDKVFFFSARFGTSIINQIKEQGLEKTSVSTDQDSLDLYHRTYLSDSKFAYEP